MAGAGAGSIPMGRTVTQIADGQVGLTVPFADLDYSDQGVKAKLSNMTGRKRLVKNATSGVLNPGEHVKYAAGKYGKEIGAKAGAGDISHGVVDSYVGSAGVADGSYFWLIVHGPCRMLSAAAIAAGALIETAASGKTQTASGAVGIDDDNVGEALEAAGGGDELIRCYFHSPVHGGG